MYIYIPVCKDYVHDTFRVFALYFKDSDMRGLLRVGIFRQCCNDTSHTLCNTSHFCFIHNPGVLQDTEMLQDYEEDKLRKSEQGGFNYLFYWISLLIQFVPQYMLYRYNWLVKLLMMKETLMLIS